MKTSKLAFFLALALILPGYSTQINAGNPFQPQIMEDECKQVTDIIVMVQNLPDDGQETWVEIHNDDSPKTIIGPDQEYPDDPSYNVENDNVCKDDTIYIRVNHQKPDNDNECPQRWETWTFEKTVTGSPQSIVTVDWDSIPPQIGNCSDGPLANELDMFSS